MGEPGGEDEGTQGQGGEGQPRAMDLKLGGESSLKIDL